MKRHLVNFIGMAFLLVLFLLVLMPHVEMNSVLRPRVIPPAGIRLEEWLDDFKRWAAIGIAVSFGTACLWYMLGQIVFGLDNWRKSDKRNIWYLLLLIPSAVAILAIVLTLEAQEGAWIAYLFYALNGIVLYHLATVLFSPSSYKYTPVGSSKIRRW